MLEIDEVRFHCHGPSRSSKPPCRSMQAQWNIEENLSHLPKDCSCSRRHCFQSCGLEKHLWLSIMLNWSAAFVWFLFQIVKTYKTWLQWAKHCKSWTIIRWIPLWQNLVSWHKRALVNSYLSIGKICRYNRYNMVQHGTIVPNANGRKSKWNLGWKVSTVSTKHAKTSATTENGFCKRLMIMK